MNNEKKKFVMVFVCFIFLYFLRTAYSDGICEFTLESGEKMNIEEIPQMSVDLSHCGESYHSLVFNLCANLTAASCPSINTVGPGNGCDTFNGGTSAYFWVGGFTNWEKTKYDGVFKDWNMTYTGLLQAGTPSWTRSLKTRMKCDETVEYSVNCSAIKNLQSSSLYILDITSKYACPVISPPPPPHHNKEEDKHNSVSAGGIVGIVFGGIGGMLLIIIGPILVFLFCSILVLLLVVCILVLVCLGCCSGGCLGFCVGRGKGYEKIPEDGIEMDKVV